MSCFSMIVVLLSMVMVCSGGLVFMMIVLLRNSRSLSVTFARMIVGLVVALWSYSGAMYGLMMVLCFACGISIIL